MSSNAVRMSLLRRNRLPRHQEYTEVRNAEDNETSDDKARTEVHNSEDDETSDDQASTADSNAEEHKDQPQSSQ